ncbi:E3 ubiquitin-protein ligase RHF2A-like isoform X2 [Primulina tabacum]|uniref:E3 ubiquitin-protein ligase RHF2A-like isoform X2 n=1 Tax=Primulina tabacum TaxID=48773 RepID=UPI003F5939F1
MEEEKTSENHLTSAAAFVEGGIQEACDDACSICLEDFSDGNPSTVTSCKHEFHLQCILEWCQRSSQCPMCWQPISLKDPGSQELLDAVEHERNLRMNPPRTTTIFRHPTLGDFELQHFPVSASESELEERIIQHLAAVAAMGRARQLARREGQRSRASAQGRPHFLVFSSPDASPASSATSSVDQRDVNDPAPTFMIAGPNSPFMTVGEDSAPVIARPSSAQADQLLTSASSAGADQQGTFLTNRSPAQTSQTSSQDRAGSSDFQSFSESVKSRVGAWSMKCKESITKSTRGWKEKLFNRNSSIPEPSPEVHREVDQVIAPVSRLMDHLEISEVARTNIATVSNSTLDSSTSGPTEQQHITEMGGSSSLNEDNTQAPCAASASN